MQHSEEVVEGISYKLCFRIFVGLRQLVKPNHYSRPAGLTEIEAQEVSSEQLCKRHKMIAHPIGNNRPCVLDAVFAQGMALLGEIQKSLDNVLCATLCGKTTTTWPATVVSGQVPDVDVLENDAMVFAGVQPFFKLPYVCRVKRTREASGIVTKIVVTVLRFLFVVHFVQPQ